MRISLLAATIALLGCLSPGALAGEVKYKSREQPQSPERQGQYKQQRDTQRERPPDKYHPIKEPPERRPPPDNPPPDSNPPDPPRHEPWWPHENCTDPVLITPMPGYDIPPSPPEVVMLSDALFRRLRFMEAEGFAGQVTVGWIDQVYFDASFGGARLHHPSAATGYYDIGSATRAFTAWAIYLLVDDRKLRLGTTLGELFPYAPADKRDITVEQLLGNTSGLGNTYAADGETNRDAALDTLLAQPLLHAPGQSFTESDDGYVILAAAIEVASGMHYESYLIDSGVVGQRMKHTLFWGSVGSQEEHWGQRGSGGIISTAHDLHAFVSAFLGAREDIANEVAQPRVVTDAGVGVGYGWFWTDPDSNAPILWTSGTGQLDNNVMVVVYPGGAILAVTSDRFHGDVPWSERVANALEPLLLHAEEPPMIEPSGRLSLVRPSAR